MSRECKGTVSSFREPFWNASNWSKISTILGKPWTRRAQFSWSHGKEPNKDSGWISLLKSGVVTVLTNSRANWSTGWDFLNSHSQNIQVTRIQWLYFVGKNHPASPFPEQAGSAREHTAKVSAGRHGAPLTLHCPDHTVSMELRDTQKEQGETKILACHPVKVCFGPGNTWPWPMWSR